MAPNPFGRTRVPAASYGRLVIVLSVKLAKLAVALTPVNCVWFRKLNMSRRTSNLIPFGAFRVFDRDMSRLLIGGARTKNRADSAPSLPGLGGAKHAGSSCL